MDEAKVAKAVVSKLDHFKCFTTSTAKQAPDKVGLYAWYSVPSIGDPDWKQDIEDGEDKGEQLFLNLLDRHTSRHKQPPYLTKAETSFEKKLKGKLEDDSYNELSQSLKDHESDSPAEKLKITLKSPKKREKMVDILKICAPLLTSPIYLGVAKSLQDRLTAHVSGLRSLKYTSDEDITKERISEGTETGFSKRARAMGFTTENLFVITFTAERKKGKLEKEEVRTVAEATEWMLNRWNRPSLGRS